MKSHLSLEGLDTSRGRTSKPRSVFYFQRLGWLVFAAVALPVFFQGQLNGMVILRESVEQRSQRRQQGGSKATADYSRFSHRTHVMGQKLICSACHKFPTDNWKLVRKGDAAFPDVADFPRHDTCLNCHRTQFFARQRPAPAICSNCHVNVTPRDTTRFLFPSLGDVPGGLKRQRVLSAEFAVDFPHDKHMDVVGEYLPASSRPFGFLLVSMQEKTAGSTEPKSCPVCHQTYQPQGTSDDEYVSKPPKDIGDNFWLKKGTFKTIPNSHTVCFSCHNSDAGIAPLPNDCQVCHKLKPEVAPLPTDFDSNLLAVFGIDDHLIRDASQRRHSSGSFRHEGGDHPNLSCLNCHKVQTMNTLDPRTLRVAVKSCGGADGCHITATADDGGILNYEIDQKKAKRDFVCTKCHISFGKVSVAADHLLAIEALKKN